MKLLQELLRLKEASMRAGNLSHLAQAYVDAHKERWAEKGEHMGDIEHLKVKKLGEDYSLWDGEEVVSSLAVIDGEIPTIRKIWVEKNHRGQKLISKFLWYLRTREGCVPMLLGDIHSEDTQEVVKHGLSRFEKSWYKDGEKKPFSKDTIDDFYGPMPTGWQLMLEGEGDFSKWPKFSGTDYIRDSYDWQIE